MYHDIYTIISSYLTDFDIVNSLNRLEHESVGLTRREDLAKEVNEQPLEERFIYSAKIGYKDGLIKYYNVDQVNDVMEISFHNNHLEIAKWLSSLSNVNAYIYNNVVFRFSCKNGHLKVAQWLYSLGGIDIHTRDDYAFRISCKNGHMEIVRWLYSLGNVDVHESSDHPNVSQWLNTLP